jgi:hypothetical protein
MRKSTKKIPKIENQDPASEVPPQESRQSKKATTRPGKKVISLIVDERWAARVSLCARALGESQTLYIVRIVSKSLKANLDAALDALRAEAESE